MSILYVATGFLIVAAALIGLIGWLAETIPEEE